MKGVELRTLTETLHPVEARYIEKPCHTISKERIAECVPIAELEYFTQNLVTTNFFKEYHRYPLRMLEKFTFDELCKLRYSSSIMMHDSVRKLFKTDAQYEVVRKISSSMWRWGMNSGIWNEVVTAYNNLRGFTINLPDFEIRLDYTTWYNECGYSKYSCTFLDGVFAYLVYYKQKHVMTIGFSIIGGKGVLIQQAQSTQRKGNRFLYKLPTNRMEFVVDLFMQHFPDYKLYMVDGSELADQSLNSYRRELSRLTEWVKTHRDLYNDPDSKYFDRESLKRHQDEQEEYRKCIRHLEGDRSRLKSFYRNVGKYHLSTTINVNGLTHYGIVSPEQVSLLQSFATV